MDKVKLNEELRKAGIKIKEVQKSSGLMAKDFWKKYNTSPHMGTMYTQGSRIIPLTIFLSIVKDYNLDILEFGDFSSISFDSGMLETVGKVKIPIIGKVVYNMLEIEADFSCESDIYLDGALFNINSNPNLADGMPRFVAFQTIGDTYKNFRIYNKSIIVVDRLYNYNAETLSNGNHIVIQDNGGFVIAEIIKNNDPKDLLITIHFDIDGEKPLMGSIKSFNIYGRIIHSINNH